MDCALSIWNAKVDEEKYYRTFARQYYPIGTYAPIDQTTSPFTSKEPSPWFYPCPSQITRNSAANWYQTYQTFMKGACGRSKRQPKTDRDSLYLTREVFRFDRCEGGNLRLFIGTKTNTIGDLFFLRHIVSSRFRMRFTCVKSVVNIMCLSATRTARTRTNYLAILSTEPFYKAQQKSLWKLTLLV